MIEAVPYQVHIVLTDNGAQLIPRKQDAGTARTPSIASGHPFQLCCAPHSAACMPDGADARLGGRGMSPCAPMANRAGQSG